MMNLRSITPHLRRFATEMTALVRHADPETSLRFLAGVARSAPTVLRDKTLIAADKTMRDHVSRYRVADGVRRARHRGEHFGLAREIHCRRVYEARPGFEPQPGQDVVDLGANAGVFSTRAALFGARVIAVEAQRGFIAVINDNMALNNLATQIIPVWAMVGAASGVLAAKGAFDRSSHGEGAQPPVLSMNELLAAHNVDRISLLKIDIEGSEFALFQGNLDWLERVDRAVLEIHLEWGDLAAIVEPMKAAGLQVELVNDEGQLSSLEGRRSGFIFARRPAS